MKRYAMLINLICLCFVSLIGCANSDDHDYIQNDEANESDASEIKSKSTSNPLDVIRDDSYEVFQHESAELDIIGRYISVDSDSNGVIELEKNGYKVQFALILVRNPVVNENSIYVLGEHENANKDGGRMGIPESVIKMNEEDELRDLFTTGTIEPDSKADITNMIFLDDDSNTDSFEIVVKEPSEQEADSEDESIVDNENKDWKVIEFHRK